MALPALAQLPTKERANELVAAFPGLQKNSLDPGEADYARDPFVRREVGSSVIEAHYTSLLLRLQTSELLRADADSALRAAREREHASQAGVDDATVRRNVAQANRDRAAQTIPIGDPDRDPTLQKAQQALDRAILELNNAQTQLNNASADRATAAATSESAQIEFNAAANDELKARNARSDVVKAFASDGNVFGMLIQRDIVFVRFRDDQDVEAIREVLRRYDLQVIGGISDLSLFDLKLGFPAHVPETELEHVLRLNRTVDSLANEPAVFSAVQQVMLDAPANDTRPLDNQSHPCWAWYDSATDGSDSANLIKLHEAWDNLIRASDVKSVPVVILDEAFAPNDDLNSLTSICSLSQGNRFHGDEVAGILNGASGNGKVISPAAPVSAISTCATKPIVVLHVEQAAASFSGTVDALRSILETNSARLVNVSLGYNWGKHFNRTPSGDRQIQGIVKAQGGTVRDLLSRYKDQVVVVSAAGNDCDKQNCTEPADWTSPINYAALGPSAGSATGASTNVIVVQAVKSDGTDWIQSNRGGLLKAPGVNLIACADGSNVISDDGTSLAAPVVTGIVAMMLAEKPDLQPADILSKLGVGSPAKVVDALNAVQSVLH